MFYKDNKFFSILTLMSFKMYVIFVTLYKTMKVFLISSENLFHDEVNDSTVNKDKKTKFVRFIKETL